MTTGSHQHIKFISCCLVTQQTSVPGLLLLLACVCYAKFFACMYSMCACVHLNMSFMQLLQVTSHKDAKYSTPVYMSYTTPFFEWITTCLHKPIFVMFGHMSGRPGSLSVCFDCTYGYNKASVSAIMRTTYHRHIVALKLEISYM